MLSVERQELIATIIKAQNEGLESGIRISIVGLRRSVFSLRVEAYDVDPSRDESIKVHHAILERYAIPKFDTEKTLMRKVAQLLTIDSAVQALYDALFSHPSSQVNPPLFSISITGLPIS